MIQPSPRRISSNPGTDATTALRAKSSWGLIAIALIAGASLGFAGSRIAYRFRLLHLPGQEPFERMSRELQLTQAQEAQTRQAMDQARDQIDQAQREFESKRRELLAEAYVKVRAALNPAQQQSLDRDFVPASIRLEAQKLELPAARPITAPAPVTSPTSP
jgi:hypothetical protein